MMYKICLVVLVAFINTQFSESVLLLPNGIDSSVPLYVAAQATPKVGSTVQLLKVTGAVLNLKAIPRPSLQVDAIYGYVRGHGSNNNGPQRVWSCVIQADADNEGWYHIKAGGGVICRNIPRTQSKPRKP